MPKNILQLGISREMCIHKIYKNDHGPRLYSFIIELILVFQVYHTFKIRLPRIHFFLNSGNPGSSKKKSFEGVN